MTSKFGQHGGFYYSFSQEKLAWWKSVPAKQKLEWLEEANAFLQQAMPKEKRKIMEAFRRGDYQTVRKKED